VGNFGGKRSKEEFESVVATVAGTRNKKQNKRSLDLVDGDHGVNEGRLPPFSGREPHKGSSSAFEEPFALVEAAGIEPASASTRREDLRT